jgi:amino acid permease
VLIFSIAFSTVLFTSAAVMGYKMFGESTESQFTLNLPQNLVVSKIAIWATVIALSTLFRGPLICTEHFRQDFPSFSVMLTLLLTYVAGSKSNNQICLNDNSTSYEFGRVAAPKSAEVRKRNHA